MRSCSKTRLGSFSRPRRKLCCEGCGLLPQGPGFHDLVHADRMLILKPGTRQEFESDAVKRRLTIDRNISTRIISRPSSSPSTSCTSPSSGECCPSRTRGVPRTRCTFGTSRVAVLPQMLSSLWCVSRSEAVCAISAQRFATIACLPRSFAHPTMRFPTLCRPFFFRVWHLITRVIDCDHTRNTSHRLTGSAVLCVRTPRAPCFTAWKKVYLTSRFGANGRFSASFRPCA